MPQPDLDELSCEPCKACGHPKALHRADNGACFAELNGTRASHSGVENIEARKRFRVECWCRRYESTVSAGIQAVLKHGDGLALVTAANAALERGEHQTAQKLLDRYISRSPKSERDAEWISATERSIARSKIQNSEVHGSVDGLEKPVTTDTEKQEHGPNVGSLNDVPQDSAVLLFEKDEGPGIVGVEWFHTKEYLRDLAQDGLLPNAEKQHLRHYYTQQETVLHAKLVFFEKKENVQKLKTLSCRTNVEELARAQVELAAATSHLARVCKESKTWDALQATARKWRSTREWQAITPDELKPAVEAIRHSVEHHGFWQSKWSSENLCYAALHPTDPSLKDSKALDDLTSYRRFLIGLLGAQIERKLLNADQPAPVIFKEYRDVLEAALKLVTRRGFQWMLTVAEANSSLLKIHPVEWTKRQFEILISAEKSSIRNWIMSVCDPIIRSVTASTDDSIFAGQWRAPRLIYMSPAGNARCHIEAAWSREGLVKSQELLHALADRITIFLGIELDEIAGEAHVRSAVRSDGGARVQQKGPSVEASGAESVMPTPTPTNLEPNFWRTLHQNFKCLSDEELSFLTRHPADRMLRAHGDYENKKDCGQWSISEGISESLRGRFEVEATRAGLGLIPIRGEEPMTVWLHAVFQNLLANKSKLLFCASTEGGIIQRVCEASALYCARLEKQALLDAKKNEAQPDTSVEPQIGPSSESDTDSASAEKPSSKDQNHPEEQKIREAVIRKVQNPQSFTTLTINEAAVYFEAGRRTISRWLSEGKLRAGARRGSITTDSVRQWQKKRSRKPRPKKFDTR